MSSRSHVLFENDQIRITRFANNGRLDPENIDIRLSDDGVPSRWSRQIKMTVDELFDLTDALEDVCDDIEDYEEQEADRG